MTASPDDVLGILRKWKSESIPIVCSIEFSPSGSLRCTGWVMEVLSTSAVIAHLPPFILELPLDALITATYHEPREVARELRERVERVAVSYMTLNFPSFRCQLFEMKPQLPKQTCLLQICKSMNRRSARFA